MALTIRWAPAMEQQYTFKPKGCGVTLDQVTFGAMVGAQGRAWPSGKEKWKKEKEGRQETEGDTEINVQPYNHQGAESTTLKTTVSYQVKNTAPISHWLFVIILQFNVYMFWGCI